MLYIQALFSWIWLWTWINRPELSTTTYLHTFIIRITLKACIYNWANNRYLLLIVYASLEETPQNLIELTT